MQQSLKLLLVVCAVAAASRRGSVSVTPVEKVIKLLEDLKTEVETEGTTEATTYDQFACFCKDQTKTKSTSITTGKDGIESVSADIEQKTALKADKTSELKDRAAKQEALSSDLESTTQQCAKDEAEYDAEAADLSKALSGLASAIKAMEDSTPAALIAVRSAVESSMDVAKSIGLDAAKGHRDVSALLQEAASVDPSDPTYKYHSHGIIGILKKLQTEFADKKTELDDEWKKTKATCDSTKKSLSDEIGVNGAAISSLEQDILTLKSEIASARTDLVNKEALLKDDQLYLKELTERCEVRAKDWDQRAQLRGDELAALSGALAVLKNNVSSLDAAVNLRAVPALLERGLNASAKPPAGAAGSNASGRNKTATPPSFLQGVSAQVRSHGFLARAEAASSLRARQEAVASLLHDEGLRLRSTPLSLMASRLMADPFEKVKTLIQQLVERLLAEATAEASKKGFCDEELGKARKDREYRFKESEILSVELSGLESKQDELEAEISELSAAVTQLTFDLENATEYRKAEKAANVQTLKDANDGLEAVKQAITILKVFYKQAAKATVLVQASPVDEDTSGAGFQGAYQGKQEASKGIVGMLEVIQTDFERTIRFTEAAEKQAAADFVKFDRVSRADISGKETKIQLDQEDLVTTKTSIQQKMDDLKTAMDLVDSALKVLENLKPTCIDTGMSYSERVAKREEEIAALKKALCILDPDNKEPDCAPGN